MDADRAGEAFGLVNEAQELWTRCADMLRAQVSEAVWLTTFHGTQAVGLHDHTLVLAVPSSVVKDRIEVRYLTLVRSALADAGAGDLELTVEVRTDNGDHAFEDAIDLTDRAAANGGGAGDAVHPDKLPAPGRDGRVPEEVNPRYTFDAFVIGTSNRFAHAAALSVAETPARSYNPLFIYGDAGLGKTHLQQAIAHYVQEMYPSFVVRYVTTETFLNQFVDAIRASISECGYPPSMRELGQAAGLASTSSVAHQIGALVKKGVLRQDPKRPRAYVPTATAGPEVDFAVEANPDASDASVVHTPLVGRIAAGVPITADEHVEDVLALPKQLVGSGTVFALTVRGNSMIKAHIMDGDTVAVRAQPNADRVLLGVDERSYEGGRMGQVHPVTWTRVFEGGRVWYTAMGHTTCSYAEPAFLAHVLEGIRWAARVGETRTTH